MSPPTYLCSPRRHHHEPDPGTPAEPFVWGSTTPDGMAWKCPDCESWASLSENAGYHAKTEGHGTPYLMPIDAAKELSDSQRPPPRVIKVRPLTKPRQMWLHHGGFVTDSEKPILCELNGKLVKRQPVAVWVSSRTEVS